MSETKHTKQEIARIVEEFRNSRQTRAQFSKQHGIHPTTLDSWRRKSAPRMVKVNLANPQQARQPSSFTLTLGNGRRIDCGWGFDQAELSSLIRIAETA